MTKIPGNDIADQSAIRNSQSAIRKPQSTIHNSQSATCGPLPIVRCIAGGVLMGLANLVPGVSGGTMILVVGLYEEFIGSIADITRLRFTRRGVIFLGIVGCTAFAAISTLAGTLSRAVTLHESAMFSLFIGMTLGGVPLLLGMLKKTTPSSVIGIILGLAIMLVIAFTRDEPQNKAAIKEAVAAGSFVVTPSYLKDVVGGALGMSAMVLPGISGAYMLLLLGRYETILAAVAEAKDYAVSFGRQGDPAEFMGVVIPVGLGAVLSLVVLSNLLKWMLRRYQQATLGMLLGILLGSVVGIWPFHEASHAVDYVTGAALAGGGFAATFLLSRINSDRRIANSE